LIDNALQYTHAGGQNELKARSNGHGRLFTVTDTGIGIPESDLERIFERIYRVVPPDRCEGRRHGLGLAIRAAYRGRATAGRIG